MTKITYKIRPTSINKHKLILEINHGKNNICTQFFDNGDITHYSSHHELYLFDKHNDIIISFYVKMDEVTGLEYIKEITV